VRSHQIYLEKIKKLESIKQVDLLRMELYAIFTEIILSKDIFRHNIELTGFLNKLGIEFKDYVFRSRTLIIARTLRIVETSEKEKLDHYSNVLKLMFVEKENSTNKTSKEKSNNNNYFEDILKKYSRNRK
jgi:hypothetical protein